MNEKVYFYIKNDLLYTITCYYDGRSQSVGAYSTLEVIDAFINDKPLLHEEVIEMAKNHLKIILHVPESCEEYCFNI